MFVTSTGIVARKYHGRNTNGSPGSGKPSYLLVRFTDPRTRRQKTQSITCTENQYNRFTVGDIIGLQHNTAWWALWAGWRIAV